MKDLSYIILVILLTVLSACGQKDKSKEHVMDSGVIATDSIVTKTTVKFVSTEHDFGQVREGDKVAHVFEVLNTGKSPLIIQNVRAACGCTVPKYEKTPIRPGRKGTIEVAFDTKGRPGAQRKSVMVVTNTEPPNTALFFTCEVIPAKQEN